MQTTSAAGGRPRTEDNPFSLQNWLSGTRRAWLRRVGEHRPDRRYSWQTARSTATVGERPTGARLSQWGDTPLFPSSCSDRTAVSKPVADAIDETPLLERERELDAVRDAL